VDARKVSYEEASLNAGGMRVRDWDEEEWERWTSHRTGGVYLMEGRLRGFYTTWKRGKKGGEANGLCPRTFFWSLVYVFCVVSVYHTAARLIDGWGLHCLAGLGGLIFREKRVFS